MTSLQRRALVSLVAGLVWTAALVVLFVVRGGVERFASDATTRILLSTLFVLLVLFTGFFGVPWKARYGPGKDVDERDMSVLQRATQVQLLAVMLTLAGWVIGLTEHYWVEGVMPVTWSYLMLYSALIASTLGQSLGVLIGYRRG
jgi:uncharacterized membrane protein